MTHLFPPLLPTTSTKAGRSASTAPIPAPRCARTAAANASTFKPPMPLPPLLAEPDLDPGAGIPVPPPTLPT
ncbi:hypothetical protein CVT25_014726 [Psilocybe cyanescens]|uniref:Uncharacterized protein n=1 Tax=Psilocybe cyanescens TaxID=93625 RepID=A0A409XJY3_PSICY|nr:hypothetical protein CVT25_014726 [Psilocybe cyanescens]